MKIYLSNVATDQDGALWINDIRTLDSIVNDAEATSIVVDNFLSQFQFKDMGAIIDKIISKLRINGSIVFYQLDMDILSHQHSRRAVDIGQYNDIVFGELSISSVFNIESLCDLISASGLSIETKEVNYETFQSIVTARRE